MALTKKDLVYSYYKNKFISLILKPKFIPFYINRVIKYSKLSSFDILLVSYPKSGRTWLQNLLVEIGKLGFDIENNISKNTSISDALNLLGKLDNNFPTILATHDRSSWEQIEQLQDEKQIQRKDFNEFVGKKIIYMYRDPLDVLVSQYYHIKLRNNVTKINKEDLIDNKIIGLKKVVFFMNKWMEFADLNKDLVFKMRFEDLKNNTFETLKHLSEFVGLSVSDEIITLAIENSSIERMQKKQASRSNTDPWTQTSKPNDINSYQTRNGMIGGHKEFFSVEQLMKIENIIIENLDTRYNYITKSSNSNKKEI